MRIQQLVPADLSQRELGLCSVIILKEEKETLSWVILCLRMKAWCCDENMLENRGVELVSNNHRRAEKRRLDRTGELKTRSRRTW